VVTFADDDVVVVTIHKCHLYLILNRKVYYKSYSSVDKIDYMLQRQIVVKGLGKQIDIEYPVCTKDAISSFDL
jgi:hypothetical protein